MPSIFGLPIPNDYAAGASFALSKAPSRDQYLDLQGVHAEIKAIQKRVHVFLTQIPVNSTKEHLIQQTFPVAQDFLDHIAVQQQLSYRILSPEDSIIWRRTNGRYRFEISETLPITAGVSATPRVIRPDGSVQPTPPIQSLQAKAFRFYRFASSSEDLFEAYRYLFLCFESALYDLSPRQKQQREAEWLKAALRQAIMQYSLNLSQFSKGGSDAVEGFYTAHYKAIRCATFHAQSSTLLPGSLPDAKLVLEQIRIFQPIVTDLLKAHFKASFPGSGMTIHAMDMILKSLAPYLLLGTTPREVSLAQEIQAALAAAGYFDAFPKKPEDIQPGTAEQLGKLIENARASFPFDLTQITLDDKRQGYDDEWVLTATTTGDALEHHNVRSIALCLLGEQARLPDPFLILGAGALTGKTVPIALELPENCDLEFKIRVVLRSFQQFPREFASN